MNIESLLATRDLSALESITVDCKVNKVEYSFAVADLDVESIIGGLVYGLRRKVQDTCNSEANRAKKEDGVEWDDKAFAEYATQVITDLKSGRLFESKRGGPRGTKVKGEAELVAAEFKVIAEAALRRVVAEAQLKGKNRKEIDSILARFVESRTQDVRDHWMKTAEANVAARNVPVDDLGDFTI